MEVPDGPPNQMPPVPPSSHGGQRVIIYGGKSYRTLTELVLAAVEEGRLEGEKERLDLQREVELSHKSIRIFQDSLTRAAAERDKLGHFNDDDWATAIAVQQEEEEILRHKLGVAVDALRLVDREHRNQENWVDIPVPPYPGSRARYITAGERKAVIRAVDSLRDIKGVPFSRCLCSCHIPAARKAMPVPKHKDCGECRKAIGEEVEQPPTDKRGRLPDWPKSERRG